ncbi:UNVERIFIED_CONTAM: hypothetical protein Sindi_0103800 [Sesamum indicum]
MIEEASRKAIVEYERRTITSAREGVRRQLFQEMETEHKREVSRVPEKGPERTMLNEVTSKRTITRQPGISSSPFTNWILLKVVDSGFRFPDLPKYDGSKDPREYVAALDLVINLYGRTDPIKAKLFVTTLKGNAQEWFTSLESGTIDSYEQLIHKFSFHFASKRKAKRSTTHLFTIRQREEETLKNFMGRFNNEVLEVQDLRIDMIVSILIHGLKKGPFASALAQDPPTGTEQLMEMAQKYIDEKEMNAIKDNEWIRDPGQSKGERSREGKQQSEKDRERNRTIPAQVSQVHSLDHDQRKSYDDGRKGRSPAVARLIRQGYFKHLMDKRSQAGDRSRSRSREEHRKDEAGKNAIRDNTLTKGVNTISGGPTNRDS